MDALTLAASAAESEQLLRLAEVEHILGAACLQLGLAAAATVGASQLATGRPTPNGQVPSLHPQPAASAGAIAANPVSSIPAGVAGVLTAPPPFEASRPTVKEVSAAAGGGRLPWGYGTGPFAEVFASKKGLIVEGGGGGREISGDGGGDRGGDDGRDEDDIISQLEVRLRKTITQDLETVMGESCDACFASTILDPGTPASLFWTEHDMCPTVLDVCTLSF